MPIAALIGAGASILGGMLGQKGQDKQAALNRQTQLDYAQNAIQWKSADAKAAGIHPIYALGAPTHSYAPVSLGDSLSPAISNAGQNIGRAINSVSSQETRSTAYTQAAAALQLERGALENETLRSNLARMRQTPNPAPPTPHQLWGSPGLPGQGDAFNPSIKEETKRSGFNPNEPSNEFHGIADIGYARTPAGGYMPVPSADMKQRIEDNVFHEISHFARNNVLPMIDKGRINPPFPAGFNQYWDFDNTDGYMLKFRPGKSQHRKLNWFGK